MQMPAMANCSQCSRAFPVRAQMQVPGTTLPMLVVLEEVDGMEAALAQATCQVCLKKSGPADRGLHGVLKALGLKDEDEVSASREPMVVVRPAPEAPTRAGAAVVITSGTPREVTVFDPLMGTSIAVQSGLTLPDRTRGLRHGNRRPPQSEPRLPRALREPERREPPSAVESLRGAIAESGRNAAVLRAAQEELRQRDEARRLERKEKFGKLMHWLRLTLARIRKNAASKEVWSLVETFERKVWEAADLNSRGGMNAVWTALCTSKEELEALCLKVYERPMAWERSKDVVWERMDAFEGGRRPESWDQKGGKRPSFYELEVVCFKSSTPDPNPPLPSGDEPARSRIVYPEGGKYGPDWEVVNSRHLGGVEDRIDEVFLQILDRLATWLLEQRVQLGITTECARFNLATHIPAFFQKLRQALAEEATELAAEEAAGVVDDLAATTSTSPDLPATV